MTDAEAKQLFSDVRDGKKPFDDIRDAFFPVLMAIATRYLGNWADAENVAIETLTKAFQDPHNPKLVVNPKRWLFKVANHECCDIYRKRLRDRNLILRFAYETDNIQKPDIYREDRELHNPVRDCLERLRPHLRDIVIRRFYAERLLQDLARETGFALSTVHKRLTKGMDDLRKCLKQKGVFSMAGSTIDKKTVGLLKADAHRLIQGIEAAYKKTSACWTAESFRNAGDKGTLPEDIINHIQSCRRCLSLARITGVLPSKETSTPTTQSILATYLRRWADEIDERLSPLEDDLPKAVGYFAEAMPVSDDEDATETLEIEIIGLLDILTDKNIPIHKRNNLAAELHNQAEDFAAKRSPHKP